MLLLVGLFAIRASFFSFETTEMFCRIVFGAPNVRFITLPLVLIGQFINLLKLLVRCFYV